MNKIVAIRGKSGNEWGGPMIVLFMNFSKWVDYTAKEHFGMGTTQG